MYFCNSDMCQASADSILRMQESAFNRGIITANEFRSSMCNVTQYYADNVSYYGLYNSRTIEKPSKKIDIFEAMNLLIFPYDPIRDYTKREIKKINERFRKVESLLGL